ncbi:13950_t:CDS:2 [Dentiscutata erythropus]|uniref:Alternative oxidase n=1 Tax=Dentiscutata erythropus TaxID=1348616 RepID=A0A9N8VD32_9GLOM|nr:13950_t:CDS:2 [Dentiscutata erythropus]
MFRSVITPIALASKRVATFPICYQRLMIVKRQDLTSFLFLKSIISHQFTTGSYRLLQQSPLNSRTAQQNSENKLELQIPPEILLDTRHPEPIRHEVIVSEKPLKTNDLENFDVKLNFHREPSTISDRIAYYFVKLLRLPTDFMHLMTWMRISQPNAWERALITFVQGVFYNAFFALYLLSPKTAHRVVGYLEEEAIVSYTSFLKEIDAGNIQNTKDVPDIAIDYWHLDRETATLRDVVLAIRADEATHRDTNHHFADRIVLSREDLREDINRAIANEPYKFGEKLGKVAGFSNTANEKWVK